MAGLRQHGDELELRDGAVARFRQMAFEHLGRRRGRADDDEFADHPDFADGERIAEEPEADFDGVINVFEVQSSGATP